jgi:hydroxymethylpyrimidine/phosphomethylpyrimidine kinase
MRLSEDVMTAGRVLICAGSDSGGGAGIQADIKTVTALGGFAATAITALTAQNTRGVFGVVGVEPAFIRQQMEVVLDDIGADCVKTGMLHDSDVIEAVAATLEAKAPGVPLVVDPVMVAKGGESLLAERAVETLRRRLLPRATILTPNLPEAAALAGRSVDTVETMEAAGKALLAQGAGAVLVKGGHLAGPVLRDVLVTPDGVEIFEGRRIETRHTHGTGCTLASAIACGLAQKLRLRDAVARARAYLAEAIRTAPDLGQGHGPVNHAHTVARFGR